MILYRMLAFMVKMFKKGIVPFMFYFTFWAVNVYNMIYIPGVSDEAYLRFFAALFFPVGICWGILDTIFMVLG